MLSEDVWNEISRFLSLDDLVILTRTCKLLFKFIDRLQIWNRFLEREGMKLSNSAKSARLEYLRREYYLSKFEDKCSRFMIKTTANGYRPSFINSYAVCYNERANGNYFDIFDLENLENFVTLEVHLPAEERKPCVHGRYIFTLHRRSKAFVHEIIGVEKRGNIHGLRIVLRKEIDQISEFLAYTILSSKEILALDEETVVFSTQNPYQPIVCFNFISEIHEVEEGRFGGIISSYAHKNRVYIITMDSRLIIMDSKLKLLKDFNTYIDNAHSYVSIHVSNNEIALRTNTNRFFFWKLDPSNFEIIRKIEFDHYADGLLNTHLHAFDNDHLLLQEDKELFLIRRDVEKIFWKIKIQLPGTSPSPSLFFRVDKENGQIWYGDEKSCEIVVNTFKMKKSEGKVSKLYRL